MAERRMFSKVVIDNDQFLDMSATAQLLYFHLGMYTDDEGFVGSPRKIQRSIGCSDDDMKILITKGFVIPFQSGVIVITHWYIHNTLRKDRAKVTVFKDERQRLIISDNGTYHLACDELSTKCQPIDNQLSTICPPKIRESNLREFNGREGESNAAEAATPPSPSKPAIVRHKYGEYRNVLLSDEELEKLKKELPSSYESYIERLSAYIASKGAKYKNHLATIRNWARRDREEAQNRGERPVKDYDRDILEVLNENAY